MRRSGVRFISPAPVNKGKPAIKTIAGFFFFGRCNVDVRRFSPRSTAGFNNCDVRGRQQPVKRRADCLIAGPHIPGHNLRDCTGKFANPYAVTLAHTRAAVQSTKIYQPQEALFVSISLASRQMSAIR